MLLTQRDPTEDEQATIQKVYDLVTDWIYGGDLLDIRRQSTGAERFLAARFTPPAHSMFVQLHAALDALIASDATGSDGYCYATRFGTLTTSEIRHAEGRMRRTQDGRIKIEFPITHENGEPVYRSDRPDEARWFVTPPNESVAVAENDPHMQTAMNV